MSRGSKEAVARKQIDEREHREARARVPQKLAPAVGRAAGLPVRMAFVFAHWLFGDATCRARGHSMLCPYGLAP